MHKVVRFILDEAHELLTSDGWRTSLQRLWEVGLKDCQRIYFTATLPPSHEHHFMQKAALDSSLTHWIRGETNRPELRYHVARIDSQRHTIISVLCNIAKNIEMVHFDEESRGIIFTTDAAMAEALNIEMGCFTHHSSRHIENTINMEQWIEGMRTDSKGIKHRQRWMAATPGLISGIDLDHIDAVLFGEEGMAGLFGGVQGTGRGGRKGNPCMCVLVSSGTFNPKNTNELDLRGEMKRWTHEDICRRIIPSNKMDGKAMDCTQLKHIYPRTELCDICSPTTLILRVIKKAIENAKEPCHITAVPNASNISSVATQQSLEETLSLSLSNYTSPQSSTVHPSTSKSTPFKTLQPSSFYAKATSLARGLSKALPTGVQKSKALPNRKAIVGLNVQTNVAMVENNLKQKYVKTDGLDRMIKHVGDSCYVCWILDGKHRPNTHRSIIDCGLDVHSQGMGLISFKKRYMQAFPAYHFCHGCGHPQDVNHKKFSPPSHTGYGRSCNVPDSIAVMIFALKRHPDLWVKISKKFNLPIAMSDEHFADWAGTYNFVSPNYYNGLEALIWFISAHRLKIIYI